MEIISETYRHERKFVVSEQEAIWIEKMLSNWMSKDLNTDDSGSYSVRSLYFDDLLNSAYYEKEEGFHLRKKYRVRIYLKDNYSEDSIIKLECKQRVGHKITKNISVLTMHEYQRLISNQPAEISRDGVLYDFYKDSTKIQLRPKIIVDYDRTALVDNYFNFRVTFDRNLRAGWRLEEFFKKDLLTIPVYNKNDVILELKYINSLPDHVMSILKNTRAQEQSVSKFYICMNNNYGQIKKELL